MAGRFNGPTRRRHPTSPAGIVSLGPLTRDPMVPRMLLSLALVCGGIYAAACAGLFLGQHRLVYLPERHLDQTPAERGLDYADQWITTADGVRVHAWYVPGPEDAPVVLFTHGNAGNISHRLHILELLNRLGAGVLILSYRGYGLSEGSPDEAGTYSDAQAAYQHLTTTLGIAPQRIVLFGRSLGGGIASWLAANEDCGGLVLESTFTSIPDMAAHLYPIFPVRMLARIRYDTRSRMSALRCPVLIVHGPADEVVPFSHGETLFRALRGDGDFLRIPGGHNDALMLEDAGYHRAWSRMLERTQSR